LAFVTTEASTPPIDFAALRELEYSRLDAAKQVYLDYTGSSVYPASLVRRHLDLLADGLFGNPHSANPTSLASTQMVEETRAAVLAFFNADPDEYDAVFTLNATGALKLVGESFPFGPDRPFLLTYDNHNSVNGIREFARGRGAPFMYAPITDPDLRIDSDSLHEMLSKHAGAGGLFAFPAQSNFSGVLHDLGWIKRAHDLGWKVLLDAAAYVPTNRLDLSTVKPDFASVSFYKMFGYPTGVGCLLLRRDVTDGMRRPWFAGGTVMLARACRTECETEMGFAMQTGAAEFEDGTPNFLMIPAVKLGLEYMTGVGIDRIHNHVLRLTEKLLNGVISMRHANGERLVHVYGPEDLQCRGGTLAMNLFDPSGAAIHPRLVEAQASENGISVRTGCHCNPGAGQTALHIPDEELEELFRGRDTMGRDRFHLVAGGFRQGAVRVSLGIASNEADVGAFIELIGRFLDVSAE
jgi:selenocysteine lyase/cysteine desulfurase